MKATRIPQYRFSGRERDRSWLDIHVARVDGNPPFDRRGERIFAEGSTIDEVLAELRILIERLRAYDDPPDPPAPEPLSLPVVNGRIVIPGSGSEQ